MLNLPDGKIYNFFIDDNVFFFTDIYKKNCKSIFDHFYLENLRKIHQKYGTLFTLNCFRHNHHEPDFDLSLFPDKYRSEFEDNANWLRLAFHADSEQPPYPYGKAYPEKLPEHYLRFKEEIIRIAGERTFIAPVIIHCFDVDDRGRKFLRENGMKCFAMRHATDYTFDQNFDQLEMPVDMILNLYYSDLEQMKKDLAQKIAAGQQKILIGSHEQYAYSHYRKYIPEYFDGIEAVCEMLAENNYKSVYYSECVINTAEEDNI